MVRVLAIVLAIAMFSAVLSKPVKDTKDLDQKVHHLWKRFINTALSAGNIYNDDTLTKIRTRRSVAEDCEKLQLCKLHARSSRNFFAAYELYFVNKENAKLWDHRAHTLADCERRFAHCYAGAAPAHTNTHNYFRSYDYGDYNY